MHFSCIQCIPHVDVYGLMYDVETFSESVHVFTAHRASLIIQTRFEDTVAN